MAKKRFGSSARAGLERKNKRFMREGPIDYSDIPESTDEELKSARRVGRPRSESGIKHMIAIRIAPTLLHRLRLMASKRDMPYQTLIHDLLEKAAKQK